MLDTIPEDDPSNMKIIESLAKKEYGSRAWTDFAIQNLDTSDFRG